VVHLPSQPRLPLPKSIFHLYTLQISRLVTWTFLLSHNFGRSGKFPELQYLCLENSFTSVLVSPSRDCLSCLIINSPFHIRQVRVLINRRHSLLTNLTIQALYKPLLFLHLTPDSSSSGTPAFLCSRADGASYSSEHCPTFILIRLFSSSMEG
jgi:hypothetical protein